MANDNDEYLRDQKFILETFKRFEGYFEKLFENDKKMETSLSNLTGKLMAYGIMAMVAIDYVLGKF